MQVVGNTSTAASGPGIKAAITAPADSTCSAALSEGYSAVLGTTTAWGTAATIAATSLRTPNDSIFLSGTVKAGATGGVVQIQWAQNTSSTTALVLKKDTGLMATKLNGADYAEVYYTRDAAVSPGTIMSLDGTGVSQVRQAVGGDGDKIVGVVSTQPGKTIGAADGVGAPVPIALSGRSQ